MVGDYPQVSGRQGLERGVPLGFGRSKQLSLSKFFNPSTPSMRGGERLMIIVATTSLSTVDHPNADRWNATRSCQLRAT